MLARRKDVWSKVRLVTQYFPMKMGGRGEGVKTGVEVVLPPEEGLLPSGYLNPTVGDMVQDATAMDTMARSDCSHWFYQHLLDGKVRK